MKKTLAMLTEPEADVLAGLMERAIAHNQLQVNIQSIGDDGMGGIGERFDGHGCSSFEWSVLSTMTSGEEPDDPDNDKGAWHEFEQPEVHLFITDDSAQYLAGNSPHLKRMYEQLPDEKFKDRH